jgi:hypothetical protein
MGAVIQEMTVSPPADSGQDTVIGAFTSSGDHEPAGFYFVEISGVSGGASLRLVIDGNVTALPVPELSTWAMLGIGFAGIGGYAGYRRARTLRVA